MTIRRLKVSDPDGEELFHLRWQDGALTTLFARPDMHAAIDRWLKAGVRELVLLDDGTRDGRVTEVTDPAFLERLAGSIHRQFGFVTCLAVEPTAVPTDSAVAALVVSIPGPNPRLTKTAATHPSSGQFFFPATTPTAAGSEPHLVGEAA